MRTIVNVIGFTVATIVVCACIAGAYGRFLDAPRTDPGAWSMLGVAAAVLSLMVWVALIRVSD